MREENLKKMVFFILVVIVFVLSIILIYLLVVKPQINKKYQNIYNAGVYNGQVSLMNYMLTQLKEKGITSLKISNNTSINLIQYRPQPQFNAPSESLGNVTNATGK